MLVVALIGGIIGAITSDKGEKREGFVIWSIQSGLGCLWIIVRLFIIILFLKIVFVLGSWLFS